MAQQAVQLAQAQARNWYLMPHLSFMRGVAGTTQPGAQPTQADRDQDLLEGLLAQELPERPEPPTIGVGRRIIGSIGDALLAAAAVRAGGVPPPIGPFAATIRERQQAFEAQTAQVEAEERRLRNAFLLRQFEQRLAARAEAQAPSDLDTSTETLVGTPRLVEQGVIPESALNRQVRVSIGRDPATGQIRRREFVGIAKPDEPDVETFNGIITPEDIRRDPGLEGQEGQRWLFQATKDPETGVFRDIKPVRPIGEPVTFIETPAGFVRVGRRTGEVSPVMGPEGQIVSHAAAVKDIELRNRERTQALGKDLEAGIQNRVADASAGVEAAAWAIRRYRELGGPQLVIGNQWVTSEEAKQARAAISRAAIPIRKWLFGAALTATEKASANDIIVDLENATNPGKLEANLVEMANLMWTARRTTLETAGKAGRNVTNFQSELRRVLFRTADDLMFEAPSILGEPGQTTGRDISLPGGGRVVVDPETGQLMVDE